MTYTASADKNTKKPQIAQFVATGMCLDEVCGFMHKIYAPELPHLTFGIVARPLQLSC